MPISAANSFNTRDKLSVGAQVFEVYRLDKLEEQGLGAIANLPFSLRILLENLMRCEDGRFVHADDIRALAKWTPNGPQRETAFMPARVLLQDFTGVPAVVDLATMREAMQKLGGNPKRINPLFPCRTSDRSLRSSGQLRQIRFLRSQRRARISAQSSSATSFSAGARTPSVISRSCRRTPASATR